MDYDDFRKFMINNQGYDRTEELAAGSRFVSKNFDAIARYTLSFVLSMFPELAFDPIQLAIEMALAGMGSYRQTCIDNGIDVSEVDAELIRINMEIIEAYRKGEI